MGGKTSSPVSPIRPTEEVADEEEQDIVAALRVVDPMRSSMPRREGSEREPLQHAVSGISRASQMPAPRPGSAGEPPEPVSKVGLYTNPILGTYELEDHSGTRRRLSSEVVTWFRQRNSETLQGSLAFVPWIVQQSYFDSGLEEGRIVMHRGSGAVVFSDASGFTALTERLAKKDNGAELLSQCLTAFFTPLINLINAYRGDVIKFSGDALTIYFPAVDDSKALRSRMQVPPHGSYGLPDLGPMATAVLRASACCIEIHKRLHMFDTGVDGVHLCLHIGVGCGQVTILQVGGAVPPETHVPRFEYIIAGPPLEQISIAEPLAKNGETCLSPQAWEYVKDCVIEDMGRELDERPDFHLLLKMDETKYTFPTIKYSAMERDMRHEKQFKLSELNVIRRYIPSAVFKQIEGGTLTYVNEMRHISTIFIGGSGVDVSTDDGAQVAQDLMSSVQRICYAHEGTLNKFVIDDKGMLFLLVFGLPPLVHTDDPTRAVLSCFEMSQTFLHYGLTGRFGVTTGRAYCGVCGSAQRMEYTVLGDAVNLSARLMANAPKDGVLVDEATRGLCSREVVLEELPPIRVKGKANPIPIFVPSRKEPPKHIGLDPSGLIKFPWYEQPPAMPQQGTSQEDLAKALKENVVHLCGLENWGAINKVQSLLGGAFSAEVHRRPVCLPQGPQAAVASPPVDSPFTSGGVIVVEGHAGMGRIELAEHMVLHAATEFGMLPVIGTVGPRVTDQVRLGMELLRSTVGAFRHLDASMPENDLEALQHMLPWNLADKLPEVQEAFEGWVEEERRRSVLFGLAEVVGGLLEMLRKRTAILVVMQLEYGTNLFPKTIEGFGPFWNVVATLAKVAMPEAAPGLLHRQTSAAGDKPVVLAIFVKEADRAHPAVKRALQKGWLVELGALSEALSMQYMAAYLEAPQGMVPVPLQRFVAKISLGNPLYIRETVEQLLLFNHIKVVRDSSGKPTGVQYDQDLETINIASWAQTSMVGNTICLLESLDPLEAAVVKMSTCFTSAFTLRDLAASACSRWAGATHLDYLRIFCATQNLVKRGIIEVPRRAAPGAEAAETASLGGASHISGTGSSRPSPPVAAQSDQLQTFEMRNVLIRKVGGSMVLEAQRKVVKRQALIDRALSRDLPARMEEVFAKRLEPHIPWYYESVLGRA